MATYINNDILGIILLQVTHNDYYCYLMYQYHALKSCITVCKRWLSIIPNISKFIINSPPKICPFIPSTIDIQYIKIIENYKINLIKYLIPLGLYIPDSVFVLPDQHFANYSRMIEICNIFNICPQQKISTLSNYIKLLKTYNKGCGGNLLFKLEINCLCNICCENIEYF